MLFRSSLSLESHIALPITPFVKAQVCIDIDLYGVVFNSPYSIGFSPSFFDRGVFGNLEFDLYFPASDSKFS